MALPVYVYDPTLNDAGHRVRGIGRHLQIIRENFDSEFTFTANLAEIPYESVFLNSFFSFLSSPLTTKRIAKVQLATIHDLIPLKFKNHFPVGLRGKLNVFRNKMALKNYDKIIAVSEHTKSDIQKLLGISESKIQVIYSTIPNLFWDSTDNESLPFPLPEKYCLYVGDATWNKNLVNLAQAIKIVDMPCIFVGNVFAGRHKDLSHPWQHELRDFFVEVGNDERFIFPGYVSDLQLLTLYRQASCNVLVSRDEGYGYSFFEAASQGLPSVLSTEEIFYETAVDAAMYGETENPHDIAKKITSVVNNTRLRAFLSHKSHERLSTISREKFRNDYLQLINQLT